MKNLEKMLIWIFVLAYANSMWLHAEASSKENKKLHLLAQQENAEAVEAFFWASYANMITMNVVVGVLGVYHLIKISLEHCQTAESQP